MRQRLFSAYAATQLLAIAAYTLLVPDDSWVQVFWQAGVGWAASAFVLVGLRQDRPAGAVAWALCGVGVFVNATGILVAGIESRIYHVQTYPTAADLVFMWILPAL